MGILHAEWYATNAGRKFPVDDEATAIDDRGRRLPSNLLVDANIRFPRELGTVLFVSSATVTASLVSLTFLGATPGESPTGFSPAAAISLAVSELVEDRVYPIESLYPGVGGWVVFGEGVRQAFQGVFSSHTQSQLAPKAARSYEPFPIPSMGKVGRASTLSGLVRLLGGNDIKVVRGFRNIEGTERECMIFRLEGPNADTLGPLRTYLGACDGRPESGTCRESAITALGEAIPDCDGNIDVVFEGDLLIGVTEAEEGGMVIDFPLGIADACTGAALRPDASGILPSEKPSECGYGPAYTLPSKNQTIGPNPIPTAESFGDTDVLQTQNLSPGTIASGESFGTVIVVLDQTLSPSTIASDESFGSPTVTIVQTLSPDSITSEESFGSPTVNAPQTILPDEIVSEEFVESPETTVAEPQFIIPDEIPSEEFFEDPDVSN